MRFAFEAGELTACAYIGIAAIFCLLIGMASDPQTVRTTA